MKTTRRQFVWLCGGATLGAGPIALLTRAEKGDAANSDSLQSVSRTSWALGSDVSITALHRDQLTAKQAIDAALHELKTVEWLMSIYREDSQLSQLNRDGVLHDPHPYFVEVLRQSQAMSRRSEGAFDITVQPLWSLYARSIKAGALPSHESLRLAQAKVDWRRVSVTDKLIRLHGEGTQITLNGIAQGFATDKATAALHANGVEHALIDAGEIGAVGQKSDGDDWAVGIQHPRVDDAYISIAKLNGRCLATSGDYATHFTNDHRLNHLFDPRTGRSPNELASVSICAATAMQADALSTATFVLGVESGMKLIRDTRGADALMVEKDGRVFVTKDFPVKA